MESGAIEIKHRKNSSHLQTDANKQPQKRISIFYLNNNFLFYDLLTFIHSLIFGFSEVLYDFFFLKKVPIFLHAKKKLQQ